MKIRNMVGVLAIFALAGCSTEAPGSPTPVETSSTTSSSTTTGEASNEPLAKLQPCDLVDSATAAQLALLSPKDVSGATYRACRWRAEGTATFDIAFHDSGLGEFKAGKGTVTDVKIGKHSGKREEGFDGPGSCTIVLGVSEMSTVDFVSVAGVDTAKACKVVEAGANAVEPKLP